MRSLAGESAFGVARGSVTEEHYATALASLRAIDWVIPLGSPSTDLVLTAGLGLAHGTSSLPADLSRPGHTQFAPFSEDDLAMLTELNVFDLRLQKEADTLHALDVESLRELQRHYPEAVAPGSGAPNCCGRVCQPGQPVA